MKFSYYPGCSLHSTAAEYEHSTKYVCKKMNIELEEIPDWSCCGASSAHSVNHMFGVAVPARNLAIAEKQGLDVLVPCAACYQRLIAVNYEMKHDAHIKENLSKVIGMDYKGETEVLSILEVFNKAGMEQIAKAVEKPLKDLKVVSYYGCYYVKPPKLVNVDDTEDPMLMDKMVEAVGATAIDWPYKTECCGNSLVFHNKDVVLSLTKDILEMAKEAGADCIITACPLCQSNTDTRQGQINKKFGTDFDIPIFYITELLAMAMGASASEIGADTHLTDTSKIIKTIST